jgi:Leucine-rich repeat (LRR) protein
MKLLLILLNLIVVVKLSSCISIDCEYKNDFIHNWGDRYSCRTKKFVNKDDERRIKVISGEHLMNRTNENVTQFFARGLNIERFPCGIGEYFVNVEVVRITSCSMRLLLKVDMGNFKRLKYLDLVGNKIVKIESDLFQDIPTLTEVMLNNNRLKFIGSKLLEPLKNIEMISFGNNPCISSQSRYSQEQLLRLKTEIKLQCSDISLADVVSRFDEIESKIENIMKKLDELDDVQ